MVKLTCAGLPWERRVLLTQGFIHTFLVRRQPLEVVPHRAFCLYVLLRFHGLPPICSWRWSDRRVVLWVGGRACVPGGTGPPLLHPTPPAEGGLLLACTPPAEARRVTHGRGPQEGPLLLVGG